eukprot:COSAG03_NODE_32_length_18233_cov_11.266847_18_plen_1227_part_00
MGRFASHSRHFTYAPLLHHVRVVNFNAIDASELAGEDSEALRKTLGERLAEIDGVEALFLRKELQVGKFEVALPFWTGAIRVEAVQVSEPESQSFKKGAHVKNEKGQVGIVTMDPDSDNDVKLKLADGSTTAYVKVSKLTVAMPEEIIVFEAELAKHLAAEVQRELPLVREIFAMFDIDEDGKLSKDEYKSHLKAAGRWRSYTEAEWNERWPEICKYLDCTTDGVTRQAFETTLYGKDRLGKAQAELERCKLGVLRDQFKQGSYAKTAEGAVGVVMYDAPEADETLGRKKANKVQLRLADGSETSHINVDALTEPTEAEVGEYEAKLARMLGLRDQFKQGSYAKTAEGAVGVVMYDAPEADETYKKANKVQLRLADGSETSHINVDALTEPTEAEVGEYEAKLALMLGLRDQFKLGSYAKTAEGAVGVVTNDAPAEGWCANKVQLRLTDGEETRHKVDTLTEATEVDYDAEFKRRFPLITRYKEGAHAKTANGTVGMVFETAVVKRIFPNGKHGIRGRSPHTVQLYLDDGSVTAEIGLEALSEASAEEMRLYEAQLAKWAALRERFKKGAYAKTTKSEVGVVMEDALVLEDVFGAFMAYSYDLSSPEHEANKVSLRLADGRETHIKVDTLAEATAAEVADYEADPRVVRRTAEAARWAVLRERFKKGVYAKTAEGAVGKVMEDPPAEGQGANEARLRLVDGEQTRHTCKVDTLMEASEAEYEAEVARWAALRERFKKGVYAKMAEGAVGMVMEDSPAEGWWVNKVRLRLADGKETRYITVDELTEVGEAAIAQETPGVKLSKLTTAEAAAGLQAEQMARDLQQAAQDCDIDAMSLLMANGATVGTTDGVSDLHSWVDQSTRPAASRAAARLWIEYNRDKSSSISALKHFYSSEAATDQEVYDAISSALAKWRQSRESPIAEVHAVVNRIRHVAPYSDARRIAMNTFIRTIGEPSALADWLEIISADSSDTTRLCDYARHSHYGHFQFVLLQVSGEQSAASPEHESRAADNQLACPEWYNAGWALELSVWQPSFTNPAAVFVSQGRLKPETLREPPHTHPYEFFSKVVTGSMRHNRYVEVADTDAGGGAYADVVFNKTHEAWPPHSGGDKCKLKATEEDIVFTAGESYRMPLGVIHDVEFDTTNSDTPAITCVIVAEQEVAPDVFMEDSMLIHHNSNPDLAKHDRSMPLVTWQANLRAIADYLRKKNTLSLQAGLDEVKETFLVQSR